MKQIRWKNYLLNVCPESSHQVNIVIFFYLLWFYSVFYKASKALLQCLATLFKNKNLQS